MSYYGIHSPRSSTSTPRGEFGYPYDRDYEPNVYYDDMGGSATPSPLHERSAPFGDMPPYVRPATNIGTRHSRGHSYSNSASIPPAGLDKLSPRLNSRGQYATIDSYENGLPPHVSSKHFTSSSRRPSGSKHPSKRGRSFSYTYTYVRPSTPYGDSDEDEVIDLMGGTYVLPAQSRSKGRRHDHYSQGHDGVWYTNHNGYPQVDEQPQRKERGYPPMSRSSTVRPTASRPPPPPSTPKTRRPSMSSSNPPRSQTVRPSQQAAHRSSKGTPSRRESFSEQPAHRSPAPTKAKATQRDADMHSIPPGFSLKNWDPNEQPILLLGSVFDANSLGKWIYDWTVARDGPKSAFSDMAGELWLIMIQVSGKLKRLEAVEGRVRSKTNREIVRDFIAAGERCLTKFEGLLKTCEQSMLTKKTSLSKTAGIDFIDALFGRDKHLGETEKLMQTFRTFNLRFDANCEEITRRPQI